MWDEINEALRTARRALSGVQSLAGWSRLTSSSGDGQSDGAGGWPSDAGEPSNQVRLLRVESWGVRGRPVIDNVYGLFVSVMGGPAARILAGIWTPKHGRQDLAAGETQIYCGTDGTEIYFDKNGKMQISAAASQNIEINVSGTGQVKVNCAAGGKVLVNGDGITDQQVALATVDVAGGYPITAAAPRRFKAGVT